MISLTESGMAIANKIYTRHKVLTALFTHLGVDPELAREDACKVEHDLSEETFAALCKHASELTEIPLAEEEEAEREAEIARASRAAKAKQ